MSEAQTQYAGTSAYWNGEVEQSPVTKQQRKIEAAVPVFTAWQAFSGRGIFDVTFRNDDMTRDSNVMVSIGELTANDSPFIGSASMSVANVAPFGDPSDASRPRGCRVRVNVAWDSNLRFQLMFLWA